MTRDVDSPTRCDGCGERTSGAVHYLDDGGKTATYCPGCETLRRVRGVEPGEHEQYKLVDAIQVRTDGDHCVGETERAGDPVAKEILSATESVGRLRHTTYELAEALETSPDAVRKRLTEFSWAHKTDDKGIEWAFDRHVVFSESIEDVLENFPGRYDEDDFYV